MKIVALIISAFIIVGVINYIPKLKVKAYEDEIDSLAFSYRVYKSNICPNRKILHDIREEYIRTIDQGNVSKLGWVNDNFDNRFMSSCLLLNPHNGDR